MQGFLNKKSRSWTEYFYLWGQSWRRKLIILTNVGLLIFDENQLNKPSKFVSTVSMTLDDQIEWREYRRDYVFKLVDCDLSEIVFAAENAEDYKKWVDAFKLVRD